MALPNISKNSIGIYPSIKIGINSDIWKNSNEIEISAILKKIRISDLYYLNRFLKRILLIETDPPVIAVNKKFSGTLFLRQRILKLIQMGALDDAEALILDADPTFDFISEYASLRVSPAKVTLPMSSSAIEPSPLII